jgi:probable rRNA maturation factor
MSPSPRRLVIENRQETRKLDLRKLRSALGRTLKTLWPEGSWEVCFHFVETEEMAKVNWDFLRHKGSTDVITFDHSADNPKATVTGEAFICVDDAVKQSRRFKTTWQEEVTRYAIHALLHLHGMTDHTDAGYRAMKKEEKRHLAALRS